MQPLLTINRRITRRSFIKTAMATFATFALSPPRLQTESKTIGYLSWINSQLRAPFQALETSGLRIVIPQALTFVYQPLGEQQHLFFGEFTFVHDFLNFGKTHQAQLSVQFIDIAQTLLVPLHDIRYIPIFGGKNDSPKRHYLSTTQWIEGYSVRLTAGHQDYLRDNQGNIRVFSPLLLTNFDDLHGYLTQRLNALSNWAVLLTCDLDFAASEPVVFFDGKTVNGQDTVDFSQPSQLYPFTPQNALMYPPRYVYMIYA